MVVREIWGNAHLGRMALKPWGSLLSVGAIA